MHISEGVLDIKVLAGGIVAAAGPVALALKRTRSDDIPRLSVMGACFFVFSLIHFRVGVSSVHLTLIGLTALVLGPSAVLAMLAGLFFQAVMFQHGGISTLGLNTAIFGIPALAVHVCFRPIARTARSRPVLLAAAGGILSGGAVLAAASLVVLTLLISGEELAGMAFLFSVSHAVLAVVEGLVTFAVLQQILRVKPEMLCCCRAGPS